jgi:aspartate racemase
MKTAGLLGGMSYESTIQYYKLINKKINNRLGNLNSAKILLYSFNFEEIEALQRNGEWDKSGDLLGVQAKHLQDANADFIAICTNTMHKLIDNINKHINIDILHISDAVGTEIKKHNLKNVLLLGTKFTMEEDFYKKILVEKYGINVTIPNEKDRNTIHDIIYKELCVGITNEVSRNSFLDTITKSINTENIDGVILGCTEIQMLINQEDFDSIKIFDSTEIHCDYIVDNMLK